jgi:hypothetical protein
VVGELSTQFKKYIKCAEEEGIVVLTPAGNHVGTLILTRLSASHGLTVQQGGQIDTYPAALGNDPELSLIVVGSHDLDGEAVASSQTGNALSLYALGKGGTCARSPGDYLDGYSGTSFGELDMINSSFFTNLKMISLSRSSSGRACWIFDVVALN